MKKYDNEPQHLNLNNDHYLMENDINLKNDNQQEEGVFKLKTFNNIMDKV